MKFKNLEEDVERWKKREPWVVQDLESKREWVFPSPLQFFVHQDREGNWMIIDRWWDVKVGEMHSSRNKAIREFYKLAERKMPSGEKIPKFPDSDYK